MFSARISSVLALSLLGAIAVPASASMTSIEGNLALSTEGLADFTGFLDYQFLGGNQGQLTVTLTNTTDASVGGYLTAFMFRTPDSFGAFTSTLVSSTYAGMTNIPAGSNGSPFPGAWFEVNGTRVKALLCDVVQASAAPGTFIDDRLTIACGTGAIRLLKLQREGKGAMEATDFLRGFPIAAGTEAA